MMNTNSAIPKTTTAPPKTATRKTEPIIAFPFGLPGFEHLHSFWLKPMPGTENFFLLQATAEPAVALLVMDARELEVYANHPIPTTELQKVDLQTNEPMALLVIVKFDKERQTLQANLRAPLIINLKQKKGIQAILDADELSTAYTLFQEN
jgi:flagellar assembly factor FliW